MIKITTEVKMKKRSDKMLRIFSSAIGKDLPKVHRKPMYSEKFGAKIVSAERGVVEIECDEVSPEMANPAGFLYGGVQCMLIDDVIGLAAATLGYEGFSISINLQITYLAKAIVGENIRIKAKIVREGRNILNTSAEIFNTDGKIIANGKSDLFQTTISRSKI